jgi:hypothetical protein
MARGLDQQPKGVYVRGGSCVHPSFLYKEYYYAKAPRAGATEVDLRRTYMASRIGYNPQDRFMVYLYNADVLAVITNKGDVFGARLQNDVLGPVFQFTGAKIGYNPQDRFMVSLHMGLLDVLVVIKDDGSVFGAEVEGTNIGPVFQFTGAKIGYNPQDRFMVTEAATGSPLLYVIRNDGLVFGAYVQATGNIQPVFQFTGARIGYNPQDRFMVALESSTLVVIKDDGSVFGAEVEGTNIGPVFQFTGAKIGYNPQDRFMVARQQQLLVITADGNVFGSLVALGAGMSGNLGPVVQINT